jgi:alkylated DNA repair dioxygenase AlkB
VAFQPSLLDVAAAPAFSASYDGLVRHALDATSWVDYCPGWLSGADALFTSLLDAGDWRQRSRRMYDGNVLEPRLTAGWSTDPSAAGTPAVLPLMCAALSERYDVTFDRVWANLYRDGRDSVAWHGDRIGRGASEDTMVAILSVGAARPLLLRPRGGSGGGHVLRYALGHGDLIVMGGSCQRTWEHAIPKLARTNGPRISIQFRPRDVS